MWPFDKKKKNLQALKKKDDGPTLEELERMAGINSQQAAKKAAIAVAKQERATRIKKKPKKQVFSAMGAIGAIRRRNQALNKVASY